jgi:peptidyl-prolyl cis-trans isomerase B (cyclophilin B)
VASSNKRERELARQKFERQQQRRLEAEEARKKRRRTIAIFSGLGIALAAVAVFLLTTHNTSPTTPSASGSPSASPSGSSAAWNGAAVVSNCTTAPEPTVKSATWKAPEPTKPAAKITLTTNCGPIVIATDPVKAPKTVESMSFLVSQGYYTNSDCFRLTTSGIFVFQCGSPTNNGQGGPGYQIPDENLPTSAGDKGYPAGTVAMANSGANTNGSQFFIVYKDGTTLGPQYTIWGRVVGGLDVHQHVATAGVQGGAKDGAPKQPLVITKATTG